MHKKLLKKYYFIEKFNKSNIDLQDKNTIIIYRNYKKKYNIKEIIDLKNYCKNKGFKFIISNNIKLSVKLDLDGAYIPSFNNDYLHLSYSFKKTFILIGSAHNLKEFRTKEKQKVKEIFLSSIFKKNNNYLGINKFKLISNFTNNKIIALGGLTEKNLKLIKLTKAIGFAGISYFR
tara:strand:+ start:1433 stop:1960 length:528 start_codon:yes stop_codon:yes gene_type:complete